MAVGADLRVYLGSGAAPTYTGFLGLRPNLPSAIVTDHGAALKKAYGAAGAPWQWQTCRATPPRSPPRTHRWNLAKDQATQRQDRPIDDPPPPPVTWSAGSGSGHGDGPHIEDWNHLQVADLKLWYDTFGETSTTDLLDGNPFGWTTAALEQHLEAVKHAFEYRAFGLRNRARTQILLDPIRIQLNGEAHEDTYFHLIRDYLDNLNGPTPYQGQLNDPFGHRSLHPY